ncbi:CHAT domain-containing protein [Microbacterium sp. HA-8]|uniref:CHAT domain-containing protein n=1 Tax=Microbacterium sp. HA-8 TaxID=3234200 RepID=UPI0038F72124
MESTAPAHLPHSEDTTRLLSVVDQLPIRTRERARLIAALGLQAHTEWSRVEVKLEASELEGLRWSGQFTTPHDLAHVCGVAQTVARAYGADMVTVAHIAVALAVSSRQAADAVSRCVGVVTEAFHLAELEGSPSILNRYLEEMELAATADAHEGEISFGYVEPWYRMQLIAPWVDPVLRIALCIALATLAARSGAFVAWPIAFAVLVPLRDSALVDAPGITRLPLGLRSRWPNLIILASVASLFRLWPVAELLVLSHVVLEVVAIVGEDIQARSARAYGPAMKRSGDARHAYIRALRLPMRYPIRDRTLRMIALLAIGIPIFLGVAEVSPAWPAFAALYVLVALGRTFTGVLYAAALVIVFGIAPTLPVLTIVVGVAARLLSVYLRRITPLPVAAPVSFPGVRPLSGALVVLRARRLVQLGQAATASRMLDAWIASLSEGQRTRAAGVQMLRAWALLEAGRAAAALELRDEFPPNEPLLRTLVVARAFHQLENVEGAQLGAKKLIEGIAKANPALRTNIALFLAEVDAKAGRPVGIVGLIPTAPSRRALVPAIRLLRLAGSSLIDENPALADRLLTSAAILGTTSRRSISEGTLVERGGTPQVPEIEAARADVAMRRCAFLASNSLPAQDFEQWRIGCEALFRVGSPLEVAVEMSAMADALRDRPEYRRASLDCRVDALATLNSTRHDMALRSDRVAWWRVYAPALHQTMTDAFHGKDWRLLAELIESARVQGDPRGAATGSTPPYVRVAGHSALEESFWQRPDTVPLIYDLEAGASTVLGPGSWWWSSWSAQGFMYWTLVRPGKPVMGGRETLGAISAALAALRDALPIPLPGEDPDDFAVRTAESVFLTGPIAHERDLMRRLGALIPLPVREAIERAAPVNLVIAPAVEYGHVPWAAVVIDGGDLRLVESARIAIAPPIALLADIAARFAVTELTVEAIAGSDAEAPAAPVRGAVIDPGGDLPQARMIVDSFPSDARVLTSADDPSIGDVTSLMDRVPGDSTFVFAGHTTIVRTDDARAALSLGGPDEFRPDKVIALDAPSGGPVFPRTTLLLACGSGDLQNTTAGEWSTLGPGVLWSGATRAVVTSFPIVDSAAADRRLVENLGTTPVHRALRHAQLAQLAEWRETRGERGAPGEWAGHIGIGSFAARPMMAAHTERSVRSWVDSSVFKLLDNAAHIASYRREDAITVRDLWDAVHAWGWDALWVRARSPWRRLGLHMFLRLRVGRALNRPVSGPLAGIDAETLAVLAEASRIALVHHHQVLNVDHVAAALLRRPGTTARVSRALTGRDTRRSEPLALMLELDHPGWEHTGIPPLTSLSHSAALSVYEATGIDPQTRPERWYFTDRSL